MTCCPQTIGYLIIHRNVFVFCLLRAHHLDSSHVYTHLHPHRLEICSFQGLTLRNMAFSGLEIRRWCLNLEVKLQNSEKCNVKWTQNIHCWLIWSCCCCFFKDLKAEALRCGRLCIKQHVGYSGLWSGMTSAVGREEKSVAPGENSAQDRKFTEVIE